ncbi:DUF885 domain-containing protein [Nakamurella deserti]|uniref:DUF885 domain-containing protein n=1 Tax=Nakamurella deserti TaxID=2164074 RepID=UPI000DBE7C82|nr:DUF885 domain-containing protein [Nakamurella deserti]
MASVTEISDHYVRQLAALSPITATYIGRPGFEGVLDDLSPAGVARKNDLDRDTLAQLAAATPRSADEIVALQVITERLELAVETFEAGYTHASLNVIESPLQNVRMVFDLMATDSDDAWELIARRMAAVPAALTGYRESLEVAAGRGLVSARRQVEKCATQCRNYAGDEKGGGFFAGLAETSGRTGALKERLSAAATDADRAYADLGSFLLTSLLPQAPVRDAVGERRYRLAIRDFAGAELDLAATYAWGWQEFLAIERELVEVAARITGGGGPAAAAAALDSDPDRQLHGTEALRDWMQRVSDEAVTELGREHFDVPDAIRVLECRIAPPGGTTGAYYTGPSDDLSRPGRMWFAVEPGREVFHPWRETTVIYHEGVPGHHLQIATQVFQREHLNDFQRLLGGTSGHAEGWALYAERLVRELGYLDDAALLGMLNDQLFRAARVVLDIGMHLESEIPPGTGFHEGERWTPELGLEFLLSRTLTEPRLAADEIDRYLGWPGQAPSYKVGERVWLKAREAARARHGDAFDLRAFHTAALNLGGMGLDPLRTLLDRL